jgi:hypothetical protein
MLRRLDDGLSTDQRWVCIQNGVRNIIQRRCSHCPRNGRFPVGRKIKSLELC